MFEPFPENEKTKEREKAKKEERSPNRGKQKRMNEKEKRMNENPIGANIKEDERNAVESACTCSLPGWSTPPPSTAAVRSIASYATPGAAGPR